MAREKTSQKLLGDILLQEPTVLQTCSVYISFIQSNTEVSFVVLTFSFNEKLCKTPIQLLHHL